MRETVHQFADRPLMIEFGVVVILLALSHGLSLAYAQASSGEESAQQRIVISAPTLIIPPPYETQVGKIKVSNNTGKAVDFNLSIGDFKKKATNEELSIVAKLDPAEFTLEPGRSKDIEVRASNFFGEGEAEAPINNRGIQTGTLKVYRESFNVNLDLPPGNPQVLFERGNTTTLMLKNNARVPHRVKWMVIVNGVKHCGLGEPEISWWKRFTDYFRPSEDNTCDSKTAWKTVYLPPNDKRGIEIKPPSGWFPRGFHGLFKNEPQPGILRLVLLPFDKNEDFPEDDPRLPEKDIGFESNLAYFSPVRQQLYSTAVIGITLFLGGLFSLIARNWLPNQLRKRDLKEKLNALALKTSGLSGHIESTLRVLVRVERKRLSDVLNSRFIVSPELASVFTQVEQGIALLDRRVTLLELIDSAYERLLNARASCPPPSLVYRIEELLEKASQLLRNTEPHEIDFSSAQTLIAEAEANVEGLNGADKQLADGLAQRITTLVQELDPSKPIVSTQTFRELRNYLPGPFYALNNDYTDPTKIPPDDYVWFDLNTMVLSVIREYARLYEGSNDPDYRQRLKSHEPELLQNLSLQSYESLRRARLLLREMKEGVFVSDIEDAIRDGVVSIEIDPPIVRPQRPVKMSIRFHRAQLNGAAARDRFTCVWDFGHIRQRSKRERAKALRADELGTESAKNERDESIKDKFIEKGWVVSHYFIGENPYQVSAWFEDPYGREVSKEKILQTTEQQTSHTETAPDDKEARTPRVDKVVLHKEVIPQLDPSAHENERFATEIVSLAVVLFIALLGLITGAREQVLKLDIVPGLIAVFLLGFGADAIKNLLTQRQV